MKQLLKTVFSPWLELPYKELFNILCWSCKLYLLVLAPYLTTIITFLLLSILVGGNFIEGVIDFTKLYFYEGQILDLVSWRIHLTWFTLCFLMSLNEELK